MERSAVIAIGGNALILDGQAGSIAEQLANARATAEQIAALVADGWRVVLTHGNGPQVGFILLRSELVGDSAPVPRLNLEMSVADSQGGIGHILSSGLLGAFAARGLGDRVACLLTHVVVDAADPAFGSPTKPIGPAYTEAEAEAKRRQGWTLVEDSGRGYRRVVASPRPVRIVELAAIERLVADGQLVIAVGGGGIPVVETDGEGYEGVEAVIDKDRASALLAASLGVPLLVLSTGVERWAPVVVGVLASAVVGWLAVVWLLRLVRGGRFWWFSLYLFPVAALVAAIALGSS